MSTQKNSVAWFVAAFVGGIIVAAIGYIKNESTIAADTKGSVFMMIVGGILFAIGAIGFFTAGNRKG